MSLLIFLPQVIMLIGLVLYFVATNGKVVEVGRLMFLSGLLATCLTGIRHP